MTETTHKILRRDLLASAAACTIALPILGCTHDEGDPTIAGESDPDTTTSSNNRQTEDGETMRVHYLEIVTTNVDAACEVYAGIHGVTFGDADPSLGGARTAKMVDGAMMGIRAPMHDGEKPVTRAYMLVDDIEASVAAAKNSGAEIAVPPMEIAGHGKCAIYFQGGIEAGLWQL